MQKNKLLPDFSIFLTKGKAKTASKVCFVKTLYTPTEDYDIKIDILINTGERLLFVECKAMEKVLQLSLLQIFLFHKVKEQLLSAQLKFH